MAITVAGKGQGSAVNADKVRIQIQKFIQDQIQAKQTAEAQQSSTRLEQAWARAKPAALRLKTRDFSDQDVQEAYAALSALRTQIHTDLMYERSNPSYAHRVEVMRKNIDSIADTVHVAKEKLSFRTGPLQALSEGLDLAEKSAYSQAADRFRACRRNGASLVALYPRLNTTWFAVGHTKNMGGTVLLRCADLAKNAEAKLKLQARF